MHSYSNTSLILVNTKVGSEAELKQHFYTEEELRADAHIFEHWVSLIFAATQDNLELLP